LLTKTYSGAGRTCRVTFELPNQGGATSAMLCGDFNNWNPSAYPMERRPDSTFALTIPLQVGRTYRFKYLIDGHRWENDWAADGYEANEYGSDDSLVVV